MRLTPAQIADFSRWLAECGAEILEPTKDHELVRIVANGQTYSVWQRGSSVQQWPKPIQEVYSAYRQGKKVKLSSQLKPDVLSQSRRQARLQALGKRDGWCCWYCARRLYNPKQLIEQPTRLLATIEEICARQIGGPTHIDNQTLACRTCNSLASNLSVVEKVTLREKIRQGEIDLRDVHRKNASGRIKKPAP